MSQKVIFSREILISEVQTKPTLWNPENPNYKKTDITSKLWNDVGNAVGLTGQ